MTPRITVRSVKAVLATLLVSLHLGAALLAGTIPQIKDRLWPLVAFYAEGLCMINTWGMFSRAPTKDEVRVVGELPDGTSVLLASSIAGRGNLLERIADLRLRKILSRLAKEEPRREFGRESLAYYCRLSPQGGERGGFERVGLHLHSAADPAAPAVLLEIDCRAAPRAPERASGAAPLVDD
jgi:hypothetical protein